MERKNKQVNAIDICVSVALYLLSAFVFYETSKFNPSVGNALDPDTWPRILCVLLCVAATVQLINALRGKVTCQVNVENKVEVFSAIALLILYTALLKPVGFLICTPVLLFGMLFLFRIRKPLPLAAIPLVTTALIYLLFHQLLRVPLPQGLLGLLA